MFRSQFCAQSPYMDVDRAGAAEVVVAPDLLEQLGAGEDPAGVLRQILQQLELLEGQIQHSALELGAVRGLVDGEVAVADLHGGVVGGDLLAAHGEPQPGLDLGRTCRVEQYVVDAPVRGDSREPALGDHEDQGTAGAGGPQQLTQGSHLRQLAAAVDEDHIGAGGVHKG